MNHNDNGDITHRLESYFDVSISDFLTEMKLWDRDRKVVVLSSSIDPKQGFSLLIEHHIRSAPVKDHEAYIGFLDIRDLVSFVIFAVKESHKHMHSVVTSHEETTHLAAVQEKPPSKEIAIHVNTEQPLSSSQDNGVVPMAITPCVASSSSSSPAAAASSDEKYIDSPRPQKNAEYAVELSLNRIMADDGFFRSRSIEPSHIGDIEPARMYENPMQAITTSYLCRRNRFVSVTPEDKLITVLQLLSTKDLHRVAVLDGGAIVGIISQSNIIHFLEKHVSEMPQNFAQTISELKMGHSPVFSALSTAPALSAFELIDKKQISGLAMIDVEGVLVGNISATDLKLFLKQPDLRILTRTLRDFLNVVRCQDLHTRALAVTVPREATLGKVIAKFAATKMHRVFVCDDDHRPILNISLTDVLASLLSTLH